MNIVIYALFALSGFAGLIYEGSWARYLKLFLGHSSYGQVLTLCIYMGGLAIGSFVAGKLVERVKRPLLGYAAVELAIGIGGLPPDVHLDYGLLLRFEFCGGVVFARGGDSEGRFGDGLDAPDCDCGGHDVPVHCGGAHAKERCRGFAPDALLYEQPRQCNWYFVHKLHLDSGTRKPHHALRRGFD